MNNVRSKILFTLAINCLSQFSVAQDNFYALTNGNVFDGVNNEVFENVTVFVKDGKIDRIAGSDAAVSSAYTIIDLEGNYLLPGMFDVHTHISALDQARRALESGVTTVRSASVSAFQDIALRELARSGKIPGHRLARRPGARFGRQRYGGHNTRVRTHNQ